MINHLLDLQSALNSIVEQQQKVVLSQPIQLIKVKEQVERQFDPAKPSQPRPDAILTALEKLETQHFEDLRPKDWRNMAWGLCQTFPSRPKKLLALEQGSKLLKYMGQNKVDVSQPNLYYPLLYSYFALQSDETQSKQLIGSNWSSLRDILAKKQKQTLSNMRSIKPWMQVLNEYPELLSRQPIAKFVDLFLEDINHPQIKNMIEHFNIPEYGWFWHSLIIQTIQQVCQLTDQLFKQKIEMLLHIAEQARFQRYQAEILVQLLDRYATSKFSYDAHEKLKTKALELWKDPQNKNNLGWNQVKPETKQMVIQWFIRADLEAFFTTFSEDADKDRFRYWLKFIKQIRSSKIFLCSEDYRSRQPAKQEFLKNNVGRYTQMSGSSAVTNAFMLLIGNIFILEFSKKGNACYVYDKNPVVGRKTVALSDLKQSGIKLASKNDSRVECPFRLKHHSPWGGHFDEKLRYLGICPDKVN